MKNDLISREALIEDLKQYFSDGTLDSVSAKLAFNMILRKIDNAPSVEAYTEEQVQEIREEVAKEYKDIIDNAPTVSDRYAEGYAQGYIDGSTGADWKGGAE